MRRVLLAGVSLTVTACAMSSAPPPAPLAKRQAAPSPYVMALADAPQCTLWREVAGQRQCLDGTPTQVAAAPEPPPVAAPRMAVTAQPLDAPQAAAAADPHAQPNLFDEMRRIGMIKGTEPIPAAPAATATAAAPSATLPRLPDAGPAPASLTPSIATVVPPPAPSKAMAFASTEPVPPQPARAGAPPRVASTVTQSWAAVDPPKPVLVAASTPQAHDTVGRAPVTAVEKAPALAPLPTVRNDTVVPLKITERATDEKPAVVVPAVPTGAQVAQGTPSAAPSLPALPSLPSLPAAASSPPAAVAAPAPVSPAPVAASSLPALPAAPAPVQAKPTPVMAPALPVPPPPAAPAVAEPAPAKASPLARAFANQAPAAKPVPVAKPAAPEREAKPAARTPKATAAANAGTGRYLVLQSFQERERADRLAQRYSKFDARVASVSIKGQTWHRVVVRDGATERKSLASDGVRGFWPITL